MTTLNPWSEPLLFHTAGEQQHAKMQALGDGSFVAVWGNENLGLSMRLFNADGTVKTAATELILAEGNGNKFNPAITVLSNGNFVVAWEDGSGKDNDQDSGIRGQIFSSDGEKIGADFHINATLPYTQAEVAITALANGGFAVAYIDFSATPDPDGTDILTRVFNANGEAVSEDLPANSTRANAQTEPAIIGLNDGRYAIFFTDNSQSKNVVLGRYFNADGTPVGLDFIVSDSAGGQYNPTAVTLADGKFVVVWETGSDDIHAQMFGANGELFGTEFVVNRMETSGFQGTPAIVALKDGGFAISYQSKGAAFGAHVVTFTSSGEFVEDFAVQPAADNPFTEGTETSMTVLTDGRLVLSWESTTTESFDVHTHAQIFDPRTKAINITGNGTADHFIGTQWADTLNGGTGADTLSGGGGDDIYMVDNAGDRVTETAGGGAGDLVYTSVSHTLAAHVENLTASGSNAISLTGNELNNVITGNEYGNAIDGGAGADALIGGAGDDTYMIDNVGDRVMEGAVGGAADHVYSSVSQTLAAYVENLTASGFTSINLTGNSLANAIAGNAGANKINGGLGKDVLKGGLGKDIFVFNTKLSSKNVDKILDYNVKSDTIHLENKYLSKLKAGKLASDAFWKGAKAHDASDRIVYDATKGYLYYDSDGTGASKQVLIATMSKKLKMAYAEFFVI